MAHDITWYDILGVPPGASAGEIQDQYDSKTSLLRPELLSGAPSTVVTAASCARGILDAARRVLVARVGCYVAAVPDGRLPGPLLHNGQVSELRRAR